MKYDKKKLGKFSDFAKKHDIPIGRLRYLCRRYDGEEFSKRLERLIELDLSVNGIQFSNLHELITYYYLSAKSLNNLLNKGVSLEGAVNSLVKERTVSYKGKDYFSLKHLTNSLGLSYKLIKDRLSLGWSLDDAVTKPLVESHSHRCSSKQGILSIRR